MAWDEPRRVCEALAPFDGLWAFVGGWAVDLTLGRQTRLHSDVDIAIMRSERRSFESLIGAVGGLDVWVYDDTPEAVLYPPDWRIRLPKGRFVLRGPDSLPYACPEWNLMRSAEWAGPQAEYAFVHLVPCLTPEGRAWLRQSLTLYNPKHPWIRRLAR